MRLVMFTDRQGPARLGALQDETIVDLSAAADSVASLIAGGAQP